MLLLGDVFSSKDNGTPSPILSHHNTHKCVFAATEISLCNICAIQKPAIDIYFIYMVLNMVGILHLNGKLTATIDTFYTVSVPCSRNRRIDQ